jgi:predicted Zn-dependent protease with MMP-like domain
VIQTALDALPPELHDEISNLEILVEEEPPEGQRLLGLYQGVPLTRRGVNYSAVLPDKITIYRGPLERIYGHDPALLIDRIAHVLRHEVAHHFGISDQRLVDIDRWSGRTTSDPSAASASPWPSGSGAGTTPR